MQKYLQLDILVPLAAIVLTLIGGVANGHAEAGKTRLADLQQSASLFSKLDENEDGYVDIEEAAGKIAPDAFSEADTNRDSKLSLAEFRAAKFHQSAQAQIT